jgi:hypothetical protein
MKNTKKSITILQLKLTSLCLLSQRVTLEIQLSIHG